MTPLIVVFLAGAFMVLISYIVNYEREKWLKMEREKRRLLTGRSQGRARSSDAQEDSLK